VPEADGQVTGPEWFAQASRGGAAVIVSCAAGQYSRIWPETQQGFFAKVVAEGVAGPADANRDLHLTPRELHQYLQTQMNAAESALGGPQTPVLLEP
jgi:hypothetical protein